MSGPFHTVAIFGKPRADGIRQALADIARIVSTSGRKVLFDAATREHVGLDEYPGASIDQIGATADVAVVVGGDGTMLGIARELAPYRIPLIGINHGRLGFMTDVALGHVATALPDMLAGRHESDHRILLEGRVMRRGETLFHARAMNDVVVSRGVAGGMIEVSIRAGRETIATQRADGLIVATPTGSTAYALSANGPVLHPSLSGILIVPVAPHTLTNRPICVPDSLVIDIELVDARDASAHFDMQAFSELEPGDVVRVQRSKTPVVLLHPLGYGFFATLREKLHWNVMPTGGASSTDRA